MDLETLTRIWSTLVFQSHPGILRVEGRPVLVGDGINVANAYYGTGRITRRLLAQGTHLVTRVKRNAAAWYPTPHRRREGHGAMALRNTLPDVPATLDTASFFATSLQERIDPYSPKRDSHSLRVAGLRQ